MKKELREKYLKLYGEEALVEAYMDTEKRRRVNGEVVVIQRKVNVFSIGYVYWLEDKVIELGG